MKWCWWPSSFEEINYRNTTEAKKKTKRRGTFNMEDVWTSCLLICLFVCVSKKNLNAMVHISGYLSVVRLSIDLYPPFLYATVESPSSAPEMPLITVEAEVNTQVNTHKNYPISDTTCRFQGKPTL